MEETTAPISTVPVKPAAKPGGKGAKGRRRDSRAAKNNPSKADAIVQQAESRLGLKSTTDLLSLSPAYALRPVGVYVDLHASNLAVTAMVQRMRNIAQRPLAQLLNAEGNVALYRKVCTYLLFARICAAQSTTTYAAGTALALYEVIDAERLRVLDARCGMIPNFLAWLMSHIGYFEYDNMKVIPVMPHPEEAAATINDALRGNYFSICYYVQRHRPGANGADIPDADNALIPELTAAFPLAVVDRRFTANSAALFNPIITGLQWDSFTEINAALNEQKNCVHDFKLSEAIGTDAMRIRFENRVLNQNAVNFYASAGCTDISIRNALITRLGCNQEIPDDLENSMFIMDRNYAILSGSDTPAPYVQAQLLMLTKLEAR